MFSLPGIMNLASHRICLFILDAGKFKAKYVAHFQQLVQSHRTCIFRMCFALVFILFSYPCFLFALIASSLSCCLSHWMYSKGYLY